MVETILLNQPIPYETLHIPDMTIFNINICCGPIPYNEVNSTHRSLRTGKSAGHNRTLPELLRYSRKAIKKTLFKLLKNTWSDEAILSK